MENVDFQKAKKASALSVLDDLAAELDSGFLEETFLVRGVNWTMRLLCDHERTWAAGYIRNQNVSSIVSSMKAPTLAIGIRSINGLTVEDFFKAKWSEANKDLSEAEKAMIAATNPYVRQYWFAEQLYVWLAARPTAFVSELFDKWNTLEKRREAAEEAMGKSSTQDGTSTESPTTPTLSSE